MSTVSFLNAQNWSDKRWLWLLIPTIPAAFTASLLVFSWSGQWLWLLFAPAHELGHKREIFDRWLAKIALAPTMYGHFFVEHNRGHHKWIATPEDPASARMGEGFWEFLPRTIFGSLLSAWRLECERLQRQGKGVWSLQNANFQAWTLSFFLYGSLMLWLGLCRALWATAAEE